MRLLLCYLIRLRNLRETLYVEPKCEGVILNVTQLCSGGSLFSNMFWSFVFKGLPLRRKQACLPEAHRRLLKKNAGRHPNHFHLFMMLLSQWRNNENINIRPNRQNCKNVLREKKMNNKLSFCSSLSEEMLKYLFLKTTATL